MRTDLNQETERFIVQNKSKNRQISDFIKERCSLPIVWGGAYVTIMPQKSVQYCDIAVRGEGEIPTLELAKAIQQGKDISNIPGICYYDDNNVYIENELAPLIQNIDSHYSVSVLVSELRQINKLNLN